LKVALAARGRPAQCYVDNGAMFIDGGLRRACAVLGIRLTHSQPGRPAGRGKIERFFRTVRDQFLVEISDNPADPSQAGTIVSSLAELNSLFTAWVEQVYHQRVHTETDMPPLQRFLAAGPPVPTPAGLLSEAFRWGEWRTVTKTATVSLHGNHYEVDAALAGAKVELVFDPFDLTDIDVRHHGRPVGKAVPFRIGKHVHPKAHADTPPPATPTGIDYLRLIETRHTRALGERLHYAHLPDPTDPAEPPSVRPPVDDHGVPYDTDLLALADTGDLTGATPEMAPDPALQTELDSFTALLAQHDGTGPSAGPTTAPDLKETP
ncbi:MAG: Mu transposase C-terminal domain-containing protein, partial [Chloroflexota bacterium]|nr:Mu transposase C-terminal domain-containing protein [Chloroflexota bacterium]